MIARAQANADRLGDGGQRRPSCLVGDVAALGFPCPIRSTTRVALRFGW